MPKPALLTTRSIGCVGAGDALGDGAHAVVGGQVGAEHLDVGELVGQLVQPSVRRATMTCGMPRLAQQPDHRLADAAGRTGDERGRERKRGGSSAQAMPPAVGQPSTAAGAAGSVGCRWRRRRPPVALSRACARPSAAVGVGVLVLVAQRLLGALLGGQRPGAVDLVAQLGDVGRGC